MTDRMLLEGLVNKYGAKRLTNVINKMNEGISPRIFPEDFENMQNDEDVINCIIDTLSKCNMFISINESIRNGGISDELFFNSSFLKKLGKSLFDNVSFTNKKYDDETGRYDL